MNQAFVNQTFMQQKNNAQNFNSHRWYFANVLFIIFKSTYLRRR